MVLLGVVGYGRGGWLAEVLAQESDQASVSPPEQSESKREALSNLSKAPGDRVHIQLDRPTFRRASVAIATKNLAPVLPQVQGSGLLSSKYLDTILKKFASELAQLLRFSSLFYVHVPSLYAPPFFSWPRDGQSLSEWLYSKPKVVGGASRRELDGVVMMSLEPVAPGRGVKLQVNIADLLAHKVRSQKVYRSTTPPPGSLLGHWARDVADDLLVRFTGARGLFSGRMVFVGKKTAKSPKQIYTSHIDGSGLRQITKHPSIHLSPFWSPIASKIMFTSYRSGDPDLYSYDLNSQKIEVVAAYQGVDSGGDADPKSNYVIYSGSYRGDADLFIIPQGSPQSRKPFIRGKGLDVEADFSPDGRWLAFVSGRFGNPHIFLAEIARSPEGVPRVVGDRRLTYAGWYNAAPDFSPDSKKIAFAGYDREIDRFDLFSMDRDGKNLERLTLRSGDNESPSWSPDGQFMVFQSTRVGTSNKKGPSGLYLMRKDGSAQRKISLPLHSAYTPVWLGDK